MSQRPSPECPGFLNVGCGPHRAPEPWWNIDIESRENIQPDELVDRGKTLVELFGHASCTAIYLGHVIEHVPWGFLLNFLTDVRLALVPGGSVAVVGPDVVRMIQGWHEGREPWHLVMSGLEDDLAQQDLGGEWEGGRHSWNAYEERVVRVLERVFPNVQPVPLESSMLDVWPVVGRASWQCAVLATT